MQTNAATIKLAKRYAEFQVENTLPVDASVTHEIVSHNVYSCEANVSIPLCKVVITIKTRPDTFDAALKELDEFLTIL